MREGSRLLQRGLLDYAGEQMEACIFFTADRPFEPGVYTVHLVDGEERIATTDLILR